MSITGRLLLIEDDASIAEGLIPILRAEGFAVTHEGRGNEGLDRARAESFDLVLTDFKLPGLNGLDLIKELHRARPRMPIILMTAHGTTDLAIEATRHGAYEYLLKPFRMEELLATVAKAAAVGRLSAERVALREPVATGDAIVGNSRAMQTVYKEIGRVAARPVTVLIRGETGTGKELVARALYQHGERSNGPFIAVNVTAIPDNLLESELFGHERGSFTGAETRRIGRFEQAHGGTLLLDEIGDLPASTQVKLLRVLQEGTIQRVGGKETITTDVRMIAATHRPLEQMIADGRFREDLFYRLAVVVIEVPPLRERREDIPELVQFFLAKYSREFGLAEPRMGGETLRLLQEHRWPGNVRELENAIRKLLLASRGIAITPELVPSILPNADFGKSFPSEDLGTLVDRLLVEAERTGAGDAHARMMALVEQELVNRALRKAGGNVSQAARWLGISRITLRQKLQARSDAPGHEISPGQS